MEKKLEELNKKIQHYLSIENNAFKIFKLWKDGYTSYGFQTIIDNKQKQHELLNDKKVRREINRLHQFEEILEEIGEIGGISIFNFKKGQDAEFWNLSFNEIIDYIIGNIRNEMLRKNAVKMQNLCTFALDEFEKTTAESQSTTFIGNELKSEDDCLYIDMNEDYEVVYNKLNGDLKDLFFEVTMNDYCISSNPPKPELNWEKLTDDNLKISQKLNDRSEAITTSIKLRNDFYRGLGEVNDDVLAPLISPIFNGGNPWPGGRPQYRIIKTENSTIIISDGLSNCFDSKKLDKELKYNGYAIEFYFEFKDDIPIEDFNNHYSLGLLNNITQNAISHGNFGSSAITVGKYQNLIC